MDEHDRTCSHRCTFTVGVVLLVALLAVLLRMEYQHTLLDFLPAAWTVAKILKGSSKTLGSFAILQPNLHKLQKDLKRALAAGTAACLLFGHQGGW